MLRSDDLSLTVPPAAAAAAALHGALLESRQRWQDLAGLAADLAFETDPDGRFTFLWPETVLGHRAATLLGRRADSLLLGTGPHPLTRRQAVRNQRAWFADASGQPRCLAVSLAPMGDARGAFAGLRGIARDVTREENAANAAAAGLRRAALLDALAETVRQAASPADALDQGLRGLRDALGCAGTAMLVLHGQDAAVACGIEDPPPGLMAPAVRSLRARGDFTDRLPTGDRLRCCRILASHRRDRRLRHGVAPADAPGMPRKSRSCAPWRPCWARCSASPGCRRNSSARPRRMR